MRTLIVTTIVFLSLAASAEARVFPVAAAEHPVALAPAHDGGFLILEEDGDLVRVSALGQAHKIATTDGGTDIDEAADGSVLLADDVASVERIAPDGTKTTALDGLSSPGGVAALPHGGFLVADSGRNEVVRVAADATMTVVATGLHNPKDVAPLPDGGVVVADWGAKAVVTVDAAGDKTKLVKEAGYVKHVAVGSDGDVWYSNGSSVNRVHDGAPQVVSKDYADAVAVEADGGALLAARNEPRIWWLPGPASERLALSIDRSTQRAAARPVVRFRLTRAAHVELTVTRGETTVSTTTIEGTAGLNKFTVPKTLKAGKGHRVAVKATTDDGRVAVDEAGLLPRGALPVEAAEAITDILASYAYVPDDGGAGGYEEFVNLCARASATRVDCEIGVHEEDIVDCDRVVAVVVDRKGRLHYDEYGCPARKRVRVHATTPVPTW